MPSDWHAWAVSAGLVPEVGSDDWHRWIAGEDRTDWRARLASPVGAEP